jgi:hypothetical protein
MDLAALKMMENGHRLNYKLAPVEAVHFLVAFDVTAPRPLSRGIFPRFHGRLTFTY